MSYFNQTDHELLDRRDALAKSILLKLAKASTRNLESISAPSATVVAGSTPLDPVWATEAKKHKVSVHDASPLVLEGREFPLVWRSHYVVVLLETIPSEIMKQLDDKGFSVIEFKPGRSNWDTAFSELANALGGSTA